MDNRKMRYGCLIPLLLVAVICFLNFCSRKPETAMDRFTRKLGENTDPEMVNEFRQGYKQGLSDSTAGASTTNSIERVIRSRISSQYSSTQIDRITINEDAGTSASGDYIALVYLTWNVKNSGKTSKDMLQTYSSDLAATVGNECPSVNEIAIFWTVPYLNNASAKCAYERRSGGMYASDTMWDSAFE